MFLEIVFKIFGIKLHFRVELAGQLFEGVSTYRNYTKKIPVLGKS